MYLNLFIFLHCHYLNLAISTHYEIIAMTWWEKASQLLIWNSFNYFPYCYMNTMSKTQWPSTMLTVIWCLLLLRIKSQLRVAYKIIHNLNKLLFHCFLTLRWCTGPNTFVRQTAFRIISHPHNLVRPFHLSSLHFLLSVSSSFSRITHVHS